MKTALEAMADAALEAQAEVKQLQAENEKLKTERTILAMLSADEPKFFNHLDIFEAKKLRDEILRDKIMIITPYFTPARFNMRNILFGWNRPIVQAIISFGSGCLFLATLLPFKTGYCRLRRPSLKIIALISREDLPAFRRVIIRSITVCSCSFSTSKLASSGCMSQPYGGCADILRF